MASKKKRRISNTEKFSKLNQQMSLLKSFAKNFDEGQTDMALPMSTTVRLLFHNTYNSHALLNQLGMDTKIKFWHSPRDSFSTTNLLPTWDLLVLEYKHIGNSGEGTYKPLGSLETFYKSSDTNGQKIPEIILPFEYWWNTIVFRVDQIVLSRKDIVLFIANKDGGAHIDKNLYDTEELKNANLLGLFINDGELPNGNPLYLAMRQIVEEILVSFEINKVSPYYVRPSYKSKIQFRKFKQNNPYLYFNYITKTDGSPTGVPNVEKNMIQRTMTWKFNFYTNTNWYFIENSSEEICIIEV